VVILGFWGLFAQYGFCKMSILAVTNTNYVKKPRSHPVHIVFERFVSGVKISKARERQTNLSKMGG
jgi:hypothetical protein